MNRTPLYLFLFLFSCQSQSGSEEQEEPIDIPTSEFIHTDGLDWKQFGTDVFEAAQNENKLIFLEVGANWCHWCHVMDEKTYSDEAVQSYLLENFIITREDQDSRPDLFARFRPWGWPAIIVFNADKEVVLRLKGYQEKTKFLNTLKEVVDNPVPVKEDSFTSSDLSASETELFNRFLARIDHEKGMYDQNHKSLSLPGIEHGIQYYNSNDSLRAWIDLTIKNSFLLVDPVWGGAYQYSTKKSWDNQHYEKILRIQAKYMEAYARYSMISKDKNAIKKSIAILEYCERFLGNASPLFYNSQNADVELGKESSEYFSLNENDRLKMGIPSVDKHCYLKENAMVARALLYLWAATEEEKYLTQSTEMIDYILGNFKRIEGVLCREENGAPPLSMEDNRQLLSTLMYLYQATGNETYLKEADQLGIALELTFGSENGLYASAGDDGIAAAIVEMNNLDAALSFNFLYHLTANESHQLNAIKYYELLDKKRLAKFTTYLPTLLKAEYELKNEPYHAVLLTEGNNEKEAKAYYRSILAHSNKYILFERLNMNELSEEQELLYGGFEGGTLFMCTSSFCSAPIYDQIGLQEFLQSQ